MTNEQKEKLKQAAAEKYPISGGLVANSIKRSAFKAGAQTILNNPSEWGLLDKQKLLSDIEAMESEYKKMESQLSRYRQALESIAARWNKVAEHNEMRTALHLIQQDVFEALKNNEG